MILCVRDILAPHFDIIDKDTNKQIKLCQWANDKTRKYKVYKTDSDRELIFNKETDTFESEIKKGNIKIVRKDSILYILFSTITTILQEIIKIKKAGY